MDIVLTKTSYIKIFLCNNYTKQDETIHVLTPKSAG